ncbi:tRNA glutamyl-Q(34) synthetase GluQRS [Rhodothermaceae bacterium RA]|nr:tRNA glutamyl-Q(34) synthetase GluQRS [Rhodothermaceae bacterium RA]
MIEQRALFEGFDQANGDLRLLVDGLDGNTLLLTDGAHILCEQGTRGGRVCGHGKGSLHSSVRADHRLPGRNRTERWQGTESARSNLCFRKVDTPLPDPLRRLSRPERPVASPPGPDPSPPADGRLSGSVRPVRGRYAPSPTGWLHVGNARTALVAWLSVRHRQGRFVWRLEDLDPPRILPGAAEAAEQDLRWLGLDWDEGPSMGGPYAPYVQSERGAYYEAALQRLAEQGRLFPCRRSRRDLQALASAPHGREGLPPYPKAWRPRQLPPDWYDAFRHGTAPAEAALRFRVDDTPVIFHDRVQGRITEAVDTSVGDFVLKRRDGLYAYQLAVVVDDLHMGITEVVRGADLLASTARQIQLIEALGGTPPAYAHVPLVLNEHGEKLSKRDEGLTLAALRTAGVRPERLVGYLAWSLGLIPSPEPCSAADLIPCFSWNRLTRSPWVLPPDLAERLR